MQETSAQTGLRVGAGLSGHLDAVMGAEYAAARCAEALGGARPDLAVVFLSSHHADAAAGVVKAVNEKLGPVCVVGCTAEAVIGGEVELENSPGVAILGMALPGVRVNTFTTEELPLPREGEEEKLDEIARTVGFGAEHRATVMFCDPFSVPLNAHLPGVSRARAHALAAAGMTEGRPGPIIGGLASGASKPGGNVMILNDRLLRTGGIGVSLSGPIRVDSLVSQGCRSIGPPLVVTACKGQMILSLGGKPALDTLSEVLDGLKEDGRQKLRRGLFIGRAITEYKERFGRDDFLIRNVIGVNKEHAAIAVADLLRVGQTIQFHVRDAVTASEDLALLLDAQKLYEPPAGALLFTCNGRGSRLFDKPHHDSAAIVRAFAQPPGGEQAAKMGKPMQAGGNGLPLAGMFCAGEIGPIGDEVFVHGQTACAALIRAEGAR